MSFLRTWLIPILAHVIATYAIAALLYSALGVISGQDALGYAGIGVGLVGFFALGRSRGIPALLVAFVSGIAVSLPAVVLSVLALSPGHDHIEVFGQLMPAYGALLGAAFGVVRGEAPNNSFKPNPLRGSA